MIGTVSVVAFVAYIGKALFGRNGNKEKDLTKDMSDFLEAPFNGISRKTIVQGVASKEFIGTVKTAPGEERYLEAYLRKGKDFTVTLTGITDAIKINKDFARSTPYEKGEFIASKHLPPSADLLDGYFLSIVSKGKKAGFLIGADQSNLTLAKKVLDDVSRKLANGEPLEETVTWLKDESPHSEKGGPSGLLLIN